jgi:hypothetical protein
LLVQRADAAMYVSKHHGEGRPTVYSRGMELDSRGGQPVPAPAH